MAILGKIAAARIPRVLAVFNGSVWGRKPPSANASEKMLPPIKVNAPSSWARRPVGALPYAVDRKWLKGDEEDSGRTIRTAQGTRVQCLSRTPLASYARCRFRKRRKRPRSDRFNLDHNAPTKKVKRAIEPVDLDLARGVEHALDLPMVKIKPAGKLTLAHAARPEGGNEGDLRRGARRDRHRRLAALTQTEHYADRHLRRQGFTTFFSHVSERVGLGTHHARPKKCAWLTRYELEKELLGERQARVPVTHIPEVLKVG